MKVISCLAPYKLAVIEAPTPRPKKDQILAKVKYCGICVYDLKRYLGKKKITYPVVLGHEPSGIVERVGANVKNLKAGDRVLVNVKVACGKCSSCRDGLESRCQDAEASNGFSQFLALPEKNVVKVPDDFDLVVGTLAEPLACCIHAYDKVKITDSSVVLVVGDGIMGMLAAFVGKSLKRARVTIAGHHDERLKKAEEIGIDIAVSIINAGAEQEKYQAVFLTVEDPALIERIDEFLHPGGTMVFMGELRKGVSRLNLNRVYQNEYTFVGSKGYTRKDFKDAVSVLREHAAQLKPLISQVYTPEELTQVFNALQQRKILKGVLSLENL